jgi:hypothetical protein
MDEAYESFNRSADLLDHQYFLASKEVLITK